MSKVHLAFFFSIVHQTCQPSPLCDHSQLHDRQAAPSRLCCCCAAVVVLYAYHVCVSLICIPKLCSFTLELGAVHASSHKKSTAVLLLLCGPTCSSPLWKAQARGNVVVLRAVLLVVRWRRRRCCAAVVVLRSSCICVSALYSQVVQFHLGVGSCACILPQRSTVLLLCSPTCIYCSPLQKIARLELYSPNKNERQVPPPSPLLLMLLLLQLYCFCCAMLLLLLLSSFGFALYSDCADSPQFCLWYQL